MTTDTAKVAVITGASSGLGRTMALEFAKQGYHVVLTARRETELQRSAELCEKQGTKAIGVVADVTDESALQRVAETAEVAFGGFDVWVNNAGVGAFGSFLDTPNETFQRVLETNVMGYVHGARCALRHFRARGHGTLINVGSTNGAAPVPLSAAYVASKYAIRGLSESLRMELELEGLLGQINVCHAMPASIDTNFFQNAANFSGRQVQALEPVYDAAYAAKRIVKLADHPKREITIGPAAKLMAWEHAAMPNFYERTMTKFINFNALSNRQAANSQGNLFEPVGANRGMDGGWRKTRLRADTLNIALGISAAAVIGLLGSGYVAARKASGQAKAQT